MRKRFLNRKARLIVSCYMKDLVRYAIMAACVVVLSGCATSQNDESESWEIYCKKYHIDPDNPTNEQENFYLDCYVGSVEEERDITGVANGVYNYYHELK